MNTEKLTTLAIIALSVVVAVGRFTIPGHGLTGWPGFYETMAHIFVGALIILAISGTNKWLSRVMLGLLTALEVVAFMGVAHAEAPVAIPSIAQAQSALTAAQSAWVAIVAAWNAVSAAYAAIAPFAAALFYFAHALTHIPQAAPGSPWSPLRWLADRIAANYGSAQNAPKV